MGQRPLTDLGQQMLSALPPVLQGSADYQAVMHPQAREFDRLSAVIEQTRAQFNPAAADLMLGAWEQIVRLPVGGFGASIAQRQQKVVVRLHKLLGASEGLEWEEQVTQIAGQGWTYEEHIPGDTTSPPELTLRIGLPYPPSADRYQEALAQIREVTPAHLEIEFSPLGGFLVDQSELDIEELSM